MTGTITRSDVALGAALAVTNVASLLAVSGDLPPGVDRPADALGVALLTFAGLVLVARHRWPVAVLVASLGTTLVAGVLGYATGGPPSIAPLLALGSATYYTGRRATIAIVAGVTAILVVLYAVFPPQDTGIGEVADMIVPNFFVVWLAAIAGDVLREQRAHAALLEQRSDELARLRRAERDKAVAEERTRIARDMHDIVGHALAAIALQARAARRRLAQGATDRADAALGEIDTLAGHALGDTRRAVGLLRSAEADGPDDPDPLLDELDALVSALRTADVRIDVRREGVGAAMPTPVQAAAYRIVQESLSNVVKHAHPAHATVTLRQEPEALVVDVRDDGARPGRAHGAGHGLRGMRERVEDLGGTLVAGPGADGGWQVTARLPGRA